MIRFECDYAEGAHQKILENMMRTNLEQTAGYSEDVYSDHARELIRQACGKEDLDVHFLVGGTQTNLTVIASVQHAGRLEHQISQRRACHLFHVSHGRIFYVYGQHRT